MFDIIPDTITSDSLSFFLKKDTSAVVSDTQKVDFSAFEYLTTDSSRLFFDIDTTAVAVQSSHSGFEGIPLPISTFTESVIFLIFLACFMLFSLVFSREGTALIGNFRNVFTSGSRRHTSIYKEQITTTEIWGELFLIFQAAAIFAIVLFVFSWDKGLSAMPQNYYYLFFGGAFLGMGVFFGLKYVIYKIIGSFVFASEMEQWIARYFWIVELLGVLSFFPAMFFVYLHEFREVALIVLLVIFFISRLVVLVTLLMFFVKHKIGFLYFIVYLCGVEIAPYLFLYKGAVSFMNIIGSIAFI